MVFVAMLWVQAPDVVQRGALIGKGRIINEQSSLQRIVLRGFKRVWYVVAESPCVAKGGQLLEHLANSLVQTSDALHQLLAFLDLNNAAHTLGPPQGDFAVFLCESQSVTFGFEFYRLVVGWQDHGLKWLSIRRQNFGSFERVDLKKQRADIRWSIFEGCCASDTRPDLSAKIGPTKLRCPQRPPTMSSILTNCQAHGLGVRATQRHVLQDNNGVWFMYDIFSSPSKVLIVDI